MGKLRGKPVYAADDNQKLHTLITRGATIDAELDKHIDDIVGRMMNAYHKHIRKQVIVTEDDLMIGIAEQMDRINAKGDPDQGATYDPHLIANSRAISCFIKQQVKADLKEHSWLRMKDGQFKAGHGLSAQPKAINLLVGGITRATEKAFMASLPDYMTLCYGLSVEELKAKTIAMLRDVDERTCLALDITQFDTIHARWSRVFMDFLFKQHGVDSCIQKLMDEINIDWVLDAGAIKLQVHERMQSGRADTLFKNTAVALFMNLAYLNIKGPKLIMAQGDDVTIIANSIKSDVADYMKPYLKPDTNPIPECVGYLLGNYLTLDLGKMACKLVNRNFYHQDTKSKDSKITEYQQAIKDRLSLIRTSYDKRHCALANAKHYGVSVYKAESVINYLYHFATCEPEDLQMDFDIDYATQFTRKAN
jgi:hypothetical protein